MSPLSQTIGSQDKSVKIEIYEGDPGQWILEIEDQYGNSTVWNDQFPSDQAALDEARKTIREEGIESLIDPPPQ
jgi:C4-type Zn-finger protein